MKVSKYFLYCMTLALLLLSSGCSNLLYYPTQILHYDPKLLGLVPEDIELKVGPKTRISGWYFKSTVQPSKGVLVFFHGNAQNMTTHYGSLAWIVKEGYDFFIWDYQGYGKSEGKPNPKNTVEDGRTVIKWVHDRNPKLPLFVFAQSLGGVIAMKSVLDLKGQVPIKALIVDSTFQSYQSVGREILSRSWITWLFQPLAYVLLSDKYTPEDKVDQISPIPLLVIHGTGDTVIKYKFGEEVFADAKEPKEFWSNKNGNHIDSFWGAYAKENRKNFLSYLEKYRLVKN